MAMDKTQKLQAWMQKAAASKSKDKKITLTFKKVSELDDIEYVPTGNALFDTIIGGFPRGRFSMLFGGPKVGIYNELVNAAQSSN